MKKAIAGGRRRLLPLLYALLFGALIALPTTTEARASLAAGDEQHVFYGYAPPTVMNWTAMEDDVPVYNYTALPARLDIIGINDSTSIEVFDLSTGDVVSSATLDRMEVHTVYLGTRVSSTTEPDVEGTYFKVVSDKLVSVCLMGGFENLYGKLNPWYEDEGFSTIYPSTDGGFLGNEFIFMTTNSCWSPVIYVLEWEVYHIFAIETSHVTVYDAEGLVTEFDVSAGSLEIISDMKTMNVYRIASTGRIMIAGLNMGSFIYLPSMTGGFVGRNFAGTMPGSIYMSPREAVMVAAQEDCEVSVYDLGRPGWHVALTGPDIKKTLAAREQWYDISMKIEIPLRIESTGDITVLMGRGGIGLREPPPEHLGDDVAFLGARAGESLTFYAPTSAILFAPEDSTVEIDGVFVPMKADEYRMLLGGIHVIHADIPIIIEVLGSGSDNQYDNWGSYIISPQGLEVTYPEPPPIGGLEEIITYIAIGVAIPVMIVVLILLRRRRAK